MKKIAVVLSTIMSAVFASSIAHGGGTTGGSTPPMVEDALMSLKSSRDHDIGQLYLENGDIGLGVNSELHAELRIATVVQANTLVVSVDDFKKIAERNDSIDVQNTDGEARTYEIGQSEREDALVLRDATSSQ